MTLRDWVKWLCVKKLASILEQNVECSLADRTATDWLTAERFVRRNPHAVKLAFARFVPASAFPGQNPEDVPLWDVVSFDYRYDAFDCACGRTVWDHLYQKFIRDLLPTGLYPHIRFG